MIVIASGWVCCVFIQSCTHRWRYLMQARTRWSQATPCSALHPSGLACSDRDLLLRATSCIFHTTFLSWELQAAHFCAPWWGQRQIDYLPLLQNTMTMVIHNVTCSTISNFTCMNVTSESCDVILSAVTKRFYTQHGTAHDDNGTTDPDPRSDRSKYRF